MAAELLAARGRPGLPGIEGVHHALVDGDAEVGHAEQVNRLPHFLRAVDIHLGEGEALVAAHAVLAPVAEHVLNDRAVVGGRVAGNVAADALVLGEDGILGNLHGDPPAVAGGRLDDVPGTGAGAVTQGSRSCKQAAGTSLYQSADAGGGARVVRCAPSRSRGCVSAGWAGSLPPRKVMDMRPPGRDVGEWGDERAVDLGVTAACDVRPLHR